jgi:putative transposase
MIMQEIDREHTRHLTKGVLQMTDYINGLDMGNSVNPKRIRRLMRKMCIHVIYPPVSLTKFGAPVYKYPYLLRNLVIDHNNQVWSTDISYIPVAHGFLYLIAIIDVHSRFIVAWGLYNTMDTVNCIEVLNAAVNRYGTPEILNSDQGCQYTSRTWADALNGYGIQISMDGRNRFLDNIWIERFWRTIKQEYIYLNPENDGLVMSQGIKDYVEYYNNKRTHQGIGHKTPAQLYLEKKKESA